MELRVRAGVAASGGVAERRRARRLRSVVGREEERGVQERPRIEALRLGQAALVPLAAGVGIRVLATDDSIELARRAGQPLGDVGARRPPDLTDGVGNGAAPSRERDVVLDADRVGLGLGAQVELVDGGGAAGLASTRQHDCGAEHEDDRHGPGTREGHAPQSASGAGERRLEDGAGRVERGELGGPGRTVHRPPGIAETGDDEREHTREQPTDEHDASNRGLVGEHEGGRLGEDQPGEHDVDERLATDRRLGRHTAGRLRSNHHPADGRIELTPPRRDRTEDGGEDADDDERIGEHLALEQGRRPGRAQGMPGEEHPREGGVDEHLAEGDRQSDVAPPPAAAVDRIWPGPQEALR